MLRLSNVRVAQGRLSRVALLKARLEFGGNPVNGISKRFERARCNSSSSSIVTGLPREHYWRHNTTSKSRSTSRVI